MARNGYENVFARRGEIAHESGSAEEPALQRVLKRGPEVAAQWQSRGTFEYADSMQIEIQDLPHMGIDEMSTRFEPLARVQFGEYVRGAIVMRLTTVLKGHEERISGEQYRWRIAPHEKSWLSLKHAAYLEAQEPQSIRLRNLPSGIRIHFPGVLPVDAKGEWFVPCLESRGNLVVLTFRSVNEGFGGNDRVAVFKTPRHVSCPQRNQYGQFAVIG